MVRGEKRKGPEKDPEPHEKHKEVEIHPPTRTHRPARAETEHRRGTERTHMNSVREQCQRVKAPSVWRQWGHLGCTNDPQVTEVSANGAARVEEGVVGDVPALAAHYPPTRRSEGKKGQCHSWTPRAVWDHGLTPTLSLLGHYWANQHLEKLPCPPPAP